MQAARGRRCLPCTSSVDSPRRRGPRLRAAQGAPKCAKVGHATPGGAPCRGSPTDVVRDGGAPSPTSVCGHAATAKGARVSGGIRRSCGGRNLAAMPYHAAPRPSFLLSYRHSCGGRNLAAMPYHAAPLPSLQRRLESRRLPAHKAEWGVVRNVMLSGAEASLRSVPSAPPV